MAVYYLDTSALVKRYASETGTVWVMNLTEPRVGHDIYTVRVTGPEMIAALFRKARTRQVSQAEAVRSAKNFRADWQMQYQVLEVTAGVVDRAMELAEKHGLLRFPESAFRALGDRTLFGPKHVQLAGKVSGH